MCGRFYIDPELEKEIKAVVEEISNKYKDTPELSAMKTGEIYPTDIVPVLTAGSPMLMKWGFTGYTGKGQIINARSETAADKPMFRKSFLRKRCLIPANYYFEWEKRGAIKQKYAIGSGKTIFLAGLYRIEPDERLPRFVILTRPAAPKLEFIHNRMPVILPKDSHELWFNNLLDSNDLILNSVENLQYEPINSQPTLFQF